MVTKIRKERPTINEHLNRIEKKAARRLTPEEEARLEKMIAAEEARDASGENWTFTGDRFIEEAAERLVIVLQDALYEFTIAGLDYEQKREALMILRRSGRYHKHTEQSIGTVFDDLSSGRDRAIDRLIEAQGRLVRGCERIEVYLKSKCGLAALDTLRVQSFSDALSAALEGYWGFYRPEECLMPAEERREWIADVSTALSVLRTIAKMEAEKAAARTE